MPANLKLSQMYSDLIHSGIYTKTVIDLELSYQPVVDEMLVTRDSSMAEKQLKSSEEIQAAVQELGKSHTEETITSLSSQHCQNMERLYNNWTMSIRALKDAQREQFQEKIEALWIEFKSNGKERMTHNEPLKTFSSNSLKLSMDTSEQKLNYLSCASQIGDQKIMEESYTINLGSQLKTTHNLRLLAIEALSLCDIRRYIVDQERTHIAMSLYSKNLSAIVMLASNQFKSYYGTQHEFYQICSRFNDFHFDSIEDQLSYIRENGMVSKTGRQTLELGDCYITRHSNLANAHVVFHLVTNDSLKNDDINSRHPMLASVRNILKTAHMYDIKTISIPLLLVDEMDEEILTVNWCLKRAELVLKCVKGFLIEMASLSSDVEQETIQFLVPRGISDELYSSLSNLVPDVFRLASSINLRSSLSFS